MEFIAKLVDKIQASVIAIVTFVVTAVGILIILANEYSKSIYPTLDTQFGGGKMVEMIIKTEDGKTYSGHLLHYNEKQYYLVKDRQTTLLIDVSQIVSIQKNF